MLFLIPKFKKKMKWSLHVERKTGRDDVKIREQEILINIHAFHFTVQRQSIAFMLLPLFLSPFENPMKIYT